MAERLVEMEKDDVQAEHLGRITNTQRTSLKEGDFASEPPLAWTVNQTTVRIDVLPTV